MRSDLLRGFDAALLCGIGSDNDLAVRIRWNIRRFPATLIPADLRKRELGRRKSAKSADGFFSSFPS
jgi:hypothetical protein